VLERLGSRLFVGGLLGACGIPAACAGQPASGVSTGDEASKRPAKAAVAPASQPPAESNPAASVGVVRSGDDYDWTNPERPVCSSDGGVPNDAGDAGTESQSNISNAAKVVSEMRPGFRDCYMQALKRNREHQGSVRLSFRVNCEGYISSIHGTLRGHLDEDTVHCIFAAAKDARFEPPLGGRPWSTFP
jgi:hypothetical protein